MVKRVSRIDPWQAGKLFAVMYFVISLLFIILTILVVSFVPMPGAKQPFPMGLLVLMPFLYAIGGLIIGPLVCWAYNVAARLVGGLQITVIDEGDT